MLGRPRYSITVGSAPSPFVWFRVAKAGTRSTLKALRDSKAVFEIENGYKLPVRAQDYPGYFRFTFVRNPYSRLLSAWRDKVLKPDAAIPARDPELGAELSDFARFVEWICDQDPAQINIHFRPQARLVPPEIDFVGRMETFEADLRNVFDRIHLGNLENVPHGNRTAKANRVEPEVTPSIQGAITKYYEDDFRRFGYTM